MKPPEFSKIYDDLSLKQYSNDEIHAFYTGRFGITFPQFSKIDVNGKDEAPLYTFLKSQKRGTFGSKIKWNFTKFLIDKDGNTVARYAPTVKPEKLDVDVAKLIKNVHLRFYRQK